MNSAQDFRVRIRSVLDKVLPKWRGLHVEEDKAAEAAIQSLAYLARPPSPYRRIFHAGERVLHIASRTEGVVQSHRIQEGVWVLSSVGIEAKCYQPQELRLLDIEEATEPVEPDHWCITNSIGDCINPNCPLHS